MANSQIFKPSSDNYGVNESDFAFTHLLYDGAKISPDAINSPNVNKYLKALRVKLEDIFNHM